MAKNKSLTLNSIFYLFYNLINVIFPFLTGMYVTHILFPETIGQVEIARNFSQYFVILSFLGIPTYGLREISKYRNDKEKSNKVYSELMVINFISTCVFTLIYIILVLLIPEYRNHFELFLIVGIAIVLNVFNNSWLYEGLEEFKYISLRNTAFKIISFILLIIFVRTSEDYLKYAAITVVGTAGNYILNIINSNKYVKFSIKELDLKQHMKSIIFLVVVNLAIEIYSLVDVTMLGKMSLKENVAFYSYGMKIHKILLQIVNTFTMVLVPKIALYYNEGKLKEYNEVLSRTFKVILLISVPIIIGIQFTANYVICKLYGDEYIRSAYVLRILTLILLISPIGYLLGSRICLVTNNENKMIVPVICGAITNVICNLILIPKYQEIGAAIASVIGEIVVMIIYVSIGKKYFILKNIQDSLKKEIISIAFMIAYLHIISGLSANLLYITLLQIFGAIIIYFGMLLILKEEFISNFAKRIFLRMNLSNKTDGGK